MRILDLGCGSGALLCALLSEFPCAYGVGVDFSARACQATKDNLALCGFADRANVVRCDWTEPLGGDFDLIVANPPYIRTADIAELEPEVRAFDPQLALDGGADGLAAYRRLLTVSSNILAKNGALVMEFGQGQGGDLENLAAAHGWGRQGLEQDLAGHDRALAFGRAAIAS